MVARLPMVAGWDGLLPGWWSELHPRFRTPSKADRRGDCQCDAHGRVELVGAGNQEAVQVTTAVGVASTLHHVLCCCLASFCFGFRSRSGRPGVGIRLAALAAFLVAFVSLIFEIVPLGEVASPALFAVKVTVAICAANGAGRVSLLAWNTTGPSTGGAFGRSLTGQ